MRLAVALFALLAGARSAASLIPRQSLPNCAASCLVDANTGSCAPTDNVCLCKNQAFVNSTTTCIESSCSGSDLQNAEAFAQQLCLAVGVTLTVSSATATSTTSSWSGAPITSSIDMFASAGATLAVAIAVVL